MSNVFRKPKPGVFAVPGEWAEGQVRYWLDKRLSADKHFAYHRFPDAKAARGALAVQPADFMFAHQNANGPYIGMLEVKETQEKYRLPKSRISQYGKLMSFALAGMPSLVLVYRSTYQDWIVFTHEHLFKDPLAKSFPFEGTANFETAAQALEKILLFRPSVQANLFQKEDEDVQTATR